MNWFKTGLLWLWDTFKVAWPLWGAVLVTAAFARSVYQLANEVSIQGDISATRWEHFLNGQPNELGDTLAGFVGSLTLIWVVASVIQQSMELKAQRREFAKMVEAQDAQVRALQAQADIFLNDLEMRMQSQAAKKFHQMMEHIWTWIESEKAHDPALRWVVCWQTYYNLSGQGARAYTNYDDVKSPNEFFYELYRSLREESKEVKLPDVEYFRGARFENVSSLLVLLKDLEGLVGSLSDDQEIKLKSLNIKSIRGMCAERLDQVSDLIKQANETP